MASSSSHEVPMKAPPQCEGPMKAPPPPPPQQEFVRAPIQEHIVGDPVARDRVVLTHMLTRERVTVSNLGQWDLVYDEDDTMGMYVTVDDSGQEHLIDLCEVFKKSVWKDRNGEIFIKSKEGSKVTTECFETDCSRFRAGRMSVCIAGTSAAVEVNAFVFKLPRQLNQRCYLSLGALYRFMKLTSFKGQPSNWISRSKGVWDQEFQKTFSAQLFIDSTMVNSGCATAKSQVPFNQRCLPEPCVSSLGFMALLQRFARLPKNKGGLGEVEPRQVADHLLSPLLQFALSSPHPTFTRFIVILQLKWVPRWPRPMFEPDGISVIHLPLTDGRLDLTSLKLAADEPATGAVARKWWKALRTMYGTTSVSVMDLMRDMPNVSELKGLQSQLLWFLSMRLEAGLGSFTTKRGPRNPKEVLHFKWLEDAHLGSSKVDLAISKYVRASRARLEGETFIGFATDKAWVHALPLQASIITLPSGTAILTVDRAFDGEHIDMSTGQKKRAAASADGEDEPATKRQADRHRNWLAARSSSAPSAKASWRPLRLQRVATKRWLSNVDNQMLVHMGTGLKLFVPDQSSHLWRGWKNWPYCGFAIDLGPDGLCGVKALEYKWRANVDLWPDVAHGCNRDLELTLRGQKLYTFWLCMVLVWNLPFGPHKEHQRFHQLSEAMEDLHTRRNYLEVPLYMAKARGIIDCLKRNGLSFDGDRDEEEQAWLYLAQRPWKGDRGSRVVLSRFCGSIHACVKQSPMWEVHEFERLYLGLEADLLTPKAIGERFTLKVGSGEQQETTTTNPQKLTFEDRQHSKSIENAVVHSVLMLEKHANQRICMAIAAAGQHLIDFYTDTAKRTTSADGIEHWVTDMVTGGIMRHLRKIVSEPFQRTTLEAVGFDMCEGGTQGLADEHCIAEDEHADMFGQLCFRMAGVRARRLLHLLGGWPASMCACLVQGKEVETINNFKGDYATYQMLKEYPNPSSAMQKFVTRSVFEKTSTLQLVAGCEDGGWKMTADLEEVLRKRCRIMVGTIAVEETLGVQKNTRMSAAQRRFKKPETSYFVALKSNLLGKRHNFTTVEADIPAENKMEKVNFNSFRAAKEGRSLDFVAVVGTSSSTSWYSPRAIAINTPCADQFLLRDLFGADAIELLENTWLGEMVDISHKVIFRDDELHEEGMWLFGLLHFPNSAVLAWPGRLVIGVMSMQWWEPDLSIQAPVVTAFCQVSDTVRACSVEWRSWMWQLKHFGDAARYMDRSLKLCVSFGPSSFLKVAAREAFWDLRLSFLERLCRHLRLDAPSNTGNLVETLLFLVKTIGDFDDGQALEIMGKRIAVNDASVLFASDLIEADEAIEVMDHRDIQKVKDEQRDGKQRIAGRDAFLSDYKKVATEVRSRAAGGGSTQRGARAARASDARPHRQGVPSEIPQASAKLFLPPSASIWRDNTRFGWCAHVPPRPRIGEPWRDDASAALRRILRRAWEQHLELQGADWSSCPWDFDRVDAGSGPSRA